MLRDNKGHHFSSAVLFLSGPKHIVYPTIKKKKILNPLSPPARPFTYDPLYVQTPQKSWLLHLLPSNPAFVPKHLIKATLADITNEFF